MLGAALVVAAALIGIGAILMLRDYSNPVFLNGGDMATRIDSEVGDTIAALSGRRRRQRAVSDPAQPHRESLWPLRASGRRR